jgi:hypothetical protein
MAAVAVSAISVLFAVWFATAYVLYVGAVLWLLWTWFLVPLGVPQIGVAWAIGISCIAALLNPAQKEDQSDDDFVDALKRLGSILTKPAIILLIGWCAKQFM